MENDKIKLIISNFLNIDVSKLKNEIDITEDLGADSLDLFQIMTEIEDEFDIVINLDDIPKLKTIINITEYVKKAID